MTSMTEDAQAIRLITEDSDLSGWVHTQGQRMTDILQAGESFQFLPRGGDASQWVEVFPDDLVLVVPPPHVSEPALRVHGLRGRQYENAIRPVRLECSERVRVGFFVVLRQRTTRDEHAINVARDNRHP